MIHADLVIIGGGPAGMAAAIEAAHHNLKITLIEENSSLGGKVLRKDGHMSTSKGHADTTEAKTRQKLFDDFGRIAHRITVLTNTEVWSVNEEKIVEFCRKTDDEPQAQTVRGKKLIVAVGAKDQTVPFPGWHLPGVFTIGGLNTFTQRGVTPGQNVLVTGTGPLQIALAYNLVSAGVKVRGLVDASTMKELLASALQILVNGGLSKLLLGAKYLLKIKGNKVPTYQGYVVTRALGTDKVEGVVISKVDSLWRPVPGTEKTIEVDAIATGYGLVPQTEITRLCNCNHFYNEEFGYWMVDRDGNMETSASGVFVAGDGADIKGYEAAIDEGKVAASAASIQLGAVITVDADRNSKALIKKLEHARAVGASMSSGARVRSGILEAVTDDTIICRCEEVCFSDIRAAVKEGAKDINDVKRRTRLGMGHCQGRFCGQFVNELIWKVSGEKLPRTNFTVRQPIKPVPFKYIAGLVGKDQI
jgi:thioredoxin reductase/bacterioferritin-associated ferredoxin